MIVDILVLAVLLISALISFLRGVIREILTIAGVIGGVVAAYFGGPLLAPMMRTWITPETAATDTAEAGEKAAEAPKLFDILPYDVVGDVLAYGLIFIVVVGVLSVLSHFLAEGAKSLGLGPVDRTLGFVFGLLRGVLLLGLIYLPVYLFITDVKTKEEWFGTSKTHFYLEKTSAAIAEFIPQSAVNDMEKNIDKVNEADQTRKKLEEINLLRARGDQAPSQDMMSAPTATPEKKQDGYSEQFREDMDQLFDEESEPRPAAPGAPVAPQSPASP